MDSLLELNREELGQLLLAIVGQLKKEGFVDTKVIDGEFHIILKMKEINHDS